MGSSPSRTRKKAEEAKNSQEITTTEKNISENGKGAGKDEVSKSEESTSWRDVKDKYLKRLLSMFQESLQYFLSAEGQTWLCSSGKDHATTLSQHCLSYKGKSLTAKQKRAILDMYLELGLPSCFNKILSDTLVCYPEIVTKDEKDLKSENRKVANENPQETNPEGDNVIPEEKAVESHLFLAQFIICKLYVVLTTWANHFPDFTVACAQAGLVKTSLQYLKSLQALPQEEDKQDIGPDNFRDNNRVRILSCALGFLHYLSRNPENKTYFDENDAVNMALPYMKCRVDFFSIKALFILVYLIEEKNNHLIMASSEPIKLLILYINQASRQGKHEYQALTLTELLQALGKVAENDNNKKTIGENDGIAAISSSLLVANKSEEVVQCCKALWILAFNDSNRKLILQDEIVMIKLKEHKNSNNPDIQKPAAGALWELQGKYGHAGDKSKGDGKSKHIMISYQWSHQKTVLRVRDALEQAGYSVWLEQGDTGGSTIDAMAQAVENSSCVLITVSKQYKDSPNCRSEAEYAFQQRRKIIPLMMESNYTPDGWLGFIVGAKFWIDFKNSVQVDKSVENLITEMRKNNIFAGSESDQAVSVEEQDSAAQGNESSFEHVIAGWDNKQVKEWLHEWGFLSSLDSKMVDRLDGKRLLRLNALREETPEFFYEAMQTDLGFNNVFSAMQFVDAVEKLASRTSPNRHS